MKTKISQWVRSLAAIVAALTLAGCTGMALPGDPGTVRDIIDIRTKVDKNSEILDRMESKLTYVVEHSETDRQNNNQIVQSAVNSTNQLLKEQQKLIEQMHNQMIVMNETLNQLAGKKPTDVVQPPTNDDVPQPLTGATPAVTAFNTGAEQFNAGNYPQAHESFGVALGQNPTPDQKMEIQYWQAVTFQKRGDMQAAEAALLAFIKEYQKGGDRAWNAVERVAEVYRQMKNPDTALSYLNAIVEKNPDYKNIVRVNATIEQVKAEKAAGAATPGQ